MKLRFSFIVPVYNRPREVRELCESLLSLEGDIPYELVLVEDGSTEDASEVVKAFQDRMNITYLVKENSGPGPSRNYGMHRAAGNYFLILDSDCLVPPGYLKAVQDSLDVDFADCFGGPDRAHASFSPVQKAIDYAMTSFWTTGGLRGGRPGAKNFEPRSFNMGLSAEAFRATTGFGNIHPGEDPDLSIRLRKLGYRLKLIPEAYVYHKRRIDFKSFYRQVRKFGRVRPILIDWHPDSARLTYWFPTAFVLGLLAAVGLSITNVPFSWVPLFAYLLYFFLVGSGAAIRHASIRVAVLSVYAVLLQFTAYGIGFLESTILVTFSRRNARELFPDLFY